jgi:hypothetical protein
VLAQVHLAELGGLVASMSVEHRVVAIDVTTLESFFDQELK